MRKFVTLLLCLVFSNLLFSQISDCSQWTWIKGGPGESNAVYGTKGISSAVNRPGARNGQSTWADSLGKLWLFGGSGYTEGSSSIGYLSDVWQFNPVSGQWTWIHGSGELHTEPIYGTKGSSAPDNTPGGRSFSSFWQDSEGSIWLYGGNASSSYFNDLWKYDISTNQWTWIQGNSVPNQAPYFATLGVPSAGNTPGARTGASTWVDGSGIFWLFGGYDHTFRPYNDLWKYDPVNAQWTAIQATTGSYSSIRPARRYHAAEWTDAQGNFIMFGGYGTTNVHGSFNDVWKYSIAENKWTRLKGDETTGSISNYGTQGMSSTSNTPGGRYSAVNWTDNQGVLWLFGGYRETNNGGAFSDLWKFDLTNNKWTWVKGDQVPNAASNYGTQGVQAFSNKPGARYASSAWGDNSGNFWLFGGLSTSYLNDLWKLSIANPSKNHYRDADGDGFGDVRNSTGNICSVSLDGYVADSTDCNDLKATVYPGATELADGLDNDCDGLIDEGFPVIKSLKVNLYGGTNPYANVEWNNWNVSASLSSGVLKYSDATASSISAQLSKSSGIPDNGATYGGGMAPAEVLRYSSSSTTARTLIFNGLTPSKHYSLELYASRSSNSTYSTIFTIGGASQAVGTYMNLTNKVVFSALTSTADGKLTLAIESPDAYNYLNGFILTESAAAPSNGKPASSAGSDQSIELPTNSTVLNGSGTDGDGTIQRYTWTKLVGPAPFTLSSRTAASPTLGGLVEGTYTFRLTVTDNLGATSFDDVTVTVAPEPLPLGTKLVKVNLYGGVNPFNNTAWTDWNVKASLSIAALKYSDGTASSVAAALSKSETIYDNGTSYGGTMAPPEVLRYASGATTERTLVLSGLSPSNTYSLELYASRNNTGNSTIFSMNEVSVVLKTDKNKSTKVVFSNLTANAQGTLTLTIKSANTYNYLNGFILTQVANNPGSNNPPTVSAGSDKSITLPQSAITLSGSASDEDGSIAAYAWTKVSGPAAHSFSSTTTPATTVSGLTEGTYVFRLRATDDDSASASDDVAVVVSAAPVTTTRFIKVNLFGGTNPYNNAEWNNWNVSSSLNSGVLKYPDASVSTISASITKHTLADNGAAYGGTMAPPEVLRYSSYATSARTLTISGLSTSKTYSIELYASRANTGNSTKFTVSGSAITVLTDNNKDTKASFVNLVPTAGGQLLISIANINSYNYLNGFILTEISTSGAPTTLVSAGTAEVAAGVGKKTGGFELTAGALELKALPNPTASYFTIRLSSSSSVPVDIRLVDVMGRVVEQKQNVAATANFTLGHNLKTGVYYLEAQQGGERKRLKLVKMP